MELSLVVRQDKLCQLRIAEHYSYIHKMFAEDTLLKQMKKGHS